jgi:hypothetical protein
MRKERQLAGLTGRKSFLPNITVLPFFQRGGVFVELFEAGSRFCQTSESISI